jgi:hypothetical protein
MVELIVKTRARLAKEGWDNGALSIFCRVLRDGEQPPAWRTIHRVLVRQQLVKTAAEEAAAVFLPQLRVPRPR